MEDIFLCEDIIEVIAMKISMNGLPCAALAGIMCYLFDVFCQ